jgi:hypothetical protein
MKATTAGPVTLIPTTMPARSFIARRANKSNAAA